jgi:hypothetical protein
MQRNGSWFSRFRPNGHSVVVTGVPWCVRECEWLKRFQICHRRPVSESLFERGLALFAETVEPKKIDLPPKRRSLLG